MRILILGAEPPALALAALAARRGHRVRLAPPDGALGGIAAAGGVDVSGLGPAGFASLSVIRLGRTEIGRADLIVVATPLNEHPSVAALLGLANARAGLLLVPGGVGGAFAFGHLSLAFVAEVPGFPLLAEFDGEHSLRVRAVKRALPVGVLPAHQRAHALDMVRDLVPDAAAADSTLETSLSNTNVLIHPPLVLANWPRVEAGTPFRLYREGLTAAGARLIERIDAERRAVAAAYHVSPIPLVDLLLRFYADQGMRSGDVAELLGTFPPFADTPGPRSPDHRYLTDDVPFGLVPLAALAGAAGVHVPTLNAVIEVLSSLCGVDFRASGRSLRQMGLQGLRAHEIAARAGDRVSAPGMAVSSNLHSGSSVLS